MPLTLEDQLTQRFIALEAGLNGQRNGALHSRRQQAMSRFHKEGFPTPKHEDWKYTDLKPALSRNWTRQESIPISFADVASLLPEGLESHVMVFSQGQFINEASQIHPEKDGIIICPFTEAQKMHPELITQHFGKYLTEANGLNALNTALATEGAFVYVPADLKMERPVHLLFLSDGMEQYRNLIITEKGGEATVIESTRTITEGESFTNIATEAFACHSSRITHYKIQAESQGTFQVNTTQFHQEGNTRCENHTLTIGGSIVRNDLNYCLADKGCEAYLFGVYVPGTNEHFDNHSFVDHAMPNCYSNELYKGVMGGNGRGVFNGKIMVRLDAQKTNAYQSNKNILLSKEAKINTKPQLEIFADDVKCSHGATVGQLDEEALFYLQSRGIGKEDARALLTQAFAADVLANVQNEPLREWMKGLLMDKLASLPH